MDTLTFLKKILPSQGVYVLAAFRNGMDRAPAHSNFDTVEALTKAALAVDSRGTQVFHACASYAEKLFKPKVFEGREVQVNRTRVASNAAWVRSQWLDIDVGPEKDYASRKDAAAALALMCKTLGLPAPMIVSSGRGLHCYWVFDEDVPAADAADSHAAFSNALKVVGFKHDASRTADLASILRPVGTHWRKEGEVEVTLVRDAAPITYGRFVSAVQSYAPPKAVDFGDEWGTGPKEYPPSSAHQIIKFCPTLRHVSEEAGNVAEPLWRAMLGLVKHTVEGEELAHEWSHGHPQYDEDQTQEKIDNWTSGPTTCTTFMLNCDLCVGCKHAEKKSPIHLGYTEEAPSAPIPEPAPVTQAEEDAVSPPKKLDPRQFRNLGPDKLPYWPSGYQWNGQQLSRKLKTSDDTIEWVPFSNSFFYPYMRFRAEDGTWATTCCELVDIENGRWREFDVPAKCLADNQALANALGAYEVFATGKNGKEHMKAFMQDTLRMMKTQRIETTTITNFGWHDNAFVLGDTKITPKGEEPVLLSDKLPVENGGDFGVAGSAIQWADLVDELYNRPGAEPYQFMICAAFGAPLVELVKSDMWHGIPIALTGDTGLGKTTTCQVACSIYGASRHMYQSTNASGSTMNAMIKRIAIAKNLPIIFDEITGRTSQELQDLLFALSNGKPKDRLRADGTLIDAGLGWDTISFVTGNVNITSLLSELDHHKAGATQMRVFEIGLADGFNNRVFQGVNAKEITDTIISRNYGYVGRDYLRYVAKHKDKLANALQKMRHKHVPQTQEETKERFFYDLMVTAMFGGALAQKLGFIRFDLNRVRTWFDTHMIAMRSHRSSTASTPEDIFQDFLSSMQRRTVTTKWFRDARIHRDKTEYVDPTKIHDPAIRNATEDRKMFFPVRVFNQWCKEGNVNAAWLRSELTKLGYFVQVLGSKDDNQIVNPFRGTNLSGSQVRCLEVNYDKIDSMGRGASHLRVVKDDEPQEAAV